MLVDRLASDLGSMLDDEFCNAYELTYNTLNNLTEVDTGPYRHAVWNFVQSFFGVCHEDVRFDKLDCFFREPERAFLKVCCTRPVDLCQLKPKAVCELMPALTPSEISSGSCTGSRVNRTVGAFSLGVILMKAADVCGLKLGKHAQPTVLLYVFIGACHVSQTVAP
ncbi:unnamed protein product [Dibothriocephalus latus]|uniref:Uncharacterized protein n=1 Tax=Dibothriocephalus latus TaxID=60516 RepID=A0A3P7QVV2_DIBLA|nr:unnamed protein product [Dibothriocephalus latus]